MATSEVNPKEITFVRPTCAMPTSSTLLWEQHGAAAYRRGEPKQAPTALRLTLQWAWLRGYEQAQVGQEG